MELILKKTIDNLGEEGDVVNVKSGFGRNYLLPQGLAVLASTSSLAILEKESAAIEARKAIICTDQHRKERQCVRVFITVDP